MNTDYTRTREVRETILQLLDAAGDYAMSEPQLFDKVNKALTPPVPRAEFDDAMNWLAAAKHFIRNIPDRLDDNLTRWLLTELGRNELNR
ncbi:MAG: hypothetical protein LBK76_08660 [Verrucomicrobiales bacterium]|jgi:hypothetical protein|nr:hypothetical protein [Verrucomicrobiales bacterium]